MLVIRLFRVGKKSQPSFKIVVTDKRRPPAGGRFVEEVGFWNPLTKERKLKGERVKYWMSVGAKPSDTVYNLLVQEKVLEGKKIPVHKKKKPSSTPASAPASAEATAGKKATEDKEKTENKEKTEEKVEEPKGAKTEEVKPKEAKPKEKKPAPAESSAAEEEKPKKEQTPNNS